MIIILTQCFPPAIGGIENLIENLSIELGKTHDVLVLADQYEKKNDSYHDLIIATGAAARGAHRRNKSSSPRVGLSHTPKRAQRDRDEFFGLLVFHHFPTNFPRKFEHTPPEPVRPNQTNPPRPLKILFD